MHLHTCILATDSRKELRRIDLSCTHLASVRREWQLHWLQCTDICHIAAIVLVTLHIAVDWGYILCVAQHLANLLSLEVLAQLCSVGQAECYNARNVRTSHRSTLHIAIARLADMIRQGRKDTAHIAILACQRVKVVEVIVLVTTRSRDCCTRTVVGVGCRGKVCRGCCYRDTIIGSTREARHWSILVARSKDCDTTLDNAVRRTCIIDKVVESLLLDR